MIIDCIGCLHGHLPELEGGDLLIVAGDLTTRNLGYEYFSFREWLIKQEYKKKIVIAGNHDGLIEVGRWKIDPPEGFEYLCDSGTEFEGLKIWGSPWSLWFASINPDCTAFTGTEDEIKSKFDLIPKDINILVTHSPPYGILDKVKKDHVGSETLRGMVMTNYFYHLQLHAFSHIHEWGGKILETPLTKFINCSIMNEKYEPVSKPVRVIL
jgi:Icc-related predicted phosphoesterase